MTAPPFHRILSGGLGLVTALALASCSGSVGDLLGDRGAQGASVGPVSGFGSVFVNGVEFDTDNIPNREVQGDDGIDEENDLEKGMILRIDGRWRDSGAGEAEAMHYDDTLRGEVTGVPEPWDPEPGTGAITVMGFDVTLDNRTLTNLNSLTDLTQGDRVRVSGWLQDDGSFRASFIGTADSGLDDEIEGRLEPDSHDEVLGQFRIGSLRVSYGTATTFEGLTPSDLDDPGRRVDVEGDYRTDNQGPYFEATTISAGFQGFLDDFSDDLEIAGTVTEAFTGSEKTGEFHLNGIRIETTNDTDFDDLDPPSITNGLLLQAEGDVRNGVLTATEVELRDGNAEVEATILGTCEVTDRCLNVGGVAVVATANTVITDDDDNDLTFDDLLSGQNVVAVEVIGLDREGDNGNGFVEALEIEREDDVDSEFELRGRLTDINRAVGTLTVLGLDLNYLTEAVFEGITSAELAQRLEAGEQLILDIQYDNDPGKFIARGVELEGEGDDN